MWTKFQYSVPYINTSDGIWLSTLMLYCSFLSTTDCWNVHMLQVLKCSCFRHPSSELYSYTVVSMGGDAIFRVMQYHDVGVNRPG